MSVVVPLYNHAAFITTAIESILAQGSIVAEILVVDDGSTDGSADVVAGLLRRDGRIGLMRQRNQGAHATINGALRRCTGEVLAILNSDDAFLPGRLAALVASLDADPGAGIAASGVMFMDGRGKATGNAWYEEAVAFSRKAVPLGVALLNGNFIMTTSNLVFRRTTLAAVGEFAALRYVHDLDWILRALALGHRVALSDERLLRYRIHAGNTIAEAHGGVRAEWAMTAAAYLSVLWDRPGAAPIDWDLADAATEVLRRHALDRAVAPCMAYLRQERGREGGRDGAGSLAGAAMLGDEAFMDRVRGWV